MCMERGKKKIENFLKNLLTREKAYDIINKLSDKREWQGLLNKPHRILKIEQWLNERTYMKNPEIPRGTEMYPEESKKLKPRAKNGKTSVDKNCKSSLMSLQEILTGQR